MPSDDPLRETAARLSALDPYAGFEVGPAPDDGWLSLGTVERDGRLDTWLALLVSRHGRRNVAGSTLGSHLAGAVIGPTVSAMMLDNRCPDPAVDNLAVRTDAGGDVQRSAILTPTVVVLPEDPGAADPHSVVVTDEAALHSWWAERAAATLSPLLAAVRARAPFGLRNLWGTVADDVAGMAIWTAQLAGRDADPAWQRAQRLIDALAQHAPVKLNRGRPFPVGYPGGTQLFQVRGTCCLYYRSALECGPPAETYCNTCPLRDDDSRERRLRDYLTESQAGNAA
jgi:hypothetical protein